MAIKTVIRRLNLDTVVWSNQSNKSNWRLLLNSVGLTIAFNIEFSATFTTNQWTMSRGGMIERSPRLLFIPIRTFQKARDRRRPMSGVAGDWQGECGWRIGLVGVAKCQWAFSDTAIDAAGVVWPAIAYSGSVWQESIASLYGRSLWLASLQPGSDIWPTDGRSLRTWTASDISVRLVR